MKKFFKFLAGTLGLAALAGGIFYALNQKAVKETADEDDDFNEDFEDPFFEEENRGYTPIPAAAEEQAVPEEETDASAEEEAVPEEEAVSEEETDASAEEDTAEENKPADTY